MSQPRNPPAIHDDFEVIERYVVTTFARYERALVTRIPTLVEPRVTEPERALVRLRMLIETLGGFAVGAAVGAVARAARRGFGAEVRDRVGLLVDRIIREGSPAVAVNELLPPPRFLSDPARPLLDALGSLLLARLRGLQPATRTHVASVHAEIMHAVPARLPLFAGVLELLVADDVSAIAFSDQLASGWLHYTAGVSERRTARRAEPKAQESEEPWRTWTLRLDGRAPSAPLTQTEVVAEGYLLQIG